nr:NAD(H) kinase 1-like [Tanacetum cinerariifolium]
MIKKGGITDVFSIGNASVVPSKNGFLDSLSLINSEKDVTEIMEQPLVMGIEDHFIEFSKAIIMLTSIEHNGNCTEKEIKNSKQHLKLMNGTNQQSQLYCGKSSIYSHKVLSPRKKNGYSDVQSKLTRKASFKLHWSVNSKKNDQHKRDIVSFDKGNISTAERSQDGISILHENVDFVVTLCGDGTVLWAASIFKDPVPLIVPFSLGSLGFMTSFRILNHHIQKRLLNFILAAFHQSPEFVAILKVEYGEQGCSYKGSLVLLLIKCINVATMLINVARCQYNISTAP